MRDIPEIDLVSTDSDDTGKGEEEGSEKKKAVEPPPPPVQGKSRKGVTAKEKNKHMTKARCV